MNKRPGAELAEGIAPGNRRYGVMLAYTPLHHLLLDFGFDALVATSGNLSDEPIAFTNEDALDRLAEIADAFLINDRDIYTRVDDSIVRTVPLDGQPEPVLIRRARGYTPEPVAAPFELPPVLAVGPELKNTVCLSRGSELFLSHHIGDLKNDAVMRSFGHAIEHLQTILEVSPQLVAHDMHPAYMSTRFALAQDELPTLAVQHHHAHMAACMCEHGLTEPAIGVIFDGTGYGTDGAIWGGEFLSATTTASSAPASSSTSGCPAATRPSSSPTASRWRCSRRPTAALERLASCRSWAPRTEQELMVLGPDGRARHPLPHDLQHGPPLRRRLGADRRARGDPLRGAGRDRARAADRAGRDGRAAALGAAPGGRRRDRRPTAARARARRGGRGAAAPTRPS